MGASGDTAKRAVEASRAASGQGQWEWTAGDNKSRSGGQSVEGRGRKGRSAGETADGTSSSVGWRAKAVVRR